MIQANNSPMWNNVSVSASRDGDHRGKLALHMPAKAQPIAARRKKWQWVGPGVLGGGDPGQGESPAPMNPADAQHNEAGGPNERLKSMLTPRTRKNALQGLALK
jgi:hypothetical protein